jgi:hypothetical protein
VIRDQSIAEIAAAFGLLCAIASTALIMGRSSLGLRVKGAIVAAGFMAGAIALLVWRPASKTEWELGVPLAFAKTRLAGPTMLEKPTLLPGALPRGFFDFALGMCTVELAALASSAALNRRRRRR